MKRTACQYAIVRFMPFVETGEFANVGILLWEPESRYLGFELIGRKFGRITQFFEQLDRGVFLKAMANLAVELERVRHLLANDLPKVTPTRLEYGFHLGIFNELIRPRETIIRYSEQRTILSAHPEKTLETLFEYYIGRNFVTKAYEDTLLEKSVKHLLEEEDLAKVFHNLKIEDTLYSVRFPFVQQVEGKAVKVIKPLFLGQSDSTAIIQHGDLWKLKVQQLRKRRLLHGPILFPVKGPADMEAGDVREEAFQETKDSLEDAGIELVLHTERQKIVDFAAQAN